jgi:enoyl-CoA hydratase
VVVEQRDHVAVVWLDGESRRNAIGLQTMGEMKLALDAIEADLDRTRVVVLTGRGRAFCSGADVMELGADSNNYDVHKSFRRDVTHRLEALPVPVVAAINGPAYAGGMELAWACDIRIAAASARFADTEIKIGLVGGVQRLRRLAPGLAADWLLTAAVLDADTALRYGLVSQVVEDDRVLDVALEKAATIASLPPLAVRGTKELIQMGYDMDMRTSDGYEREMSNRLSATEDHEEGVRAFLEKRAPNFHGR